MKGLLVEFFGDGFEVHKVALASASTLVLFILSAAGFFKVRDGGEFGHDGLATVKASGESAKCSFGLLFSVEFDVHIAQHVVAQVVADVERFDFSIFFQFEEQVFVKVFKFLLDFAFLHRRVCSFGILVQPDENQSLRERGLVVATLAFVSVSASTNFEVEWTIDSAHVGRKKKKKKEANGRGRKGEKNDY
jgi:hypothetical protein